MAVDSFKFVAEPRTETGKAAIRRLRRENKVPAIVYGGGKDAESIVLSHNAVMKSLSHEAVFSHILTLTVGNQDEMVVIKALQRHLWKPRIMHMDFQRIKASEKLTMRVPLHFMNESECPGVKDGGVISHNRSELEIRCLPANLPEYIEVDVGALALDEAIHLSALKLPQGVELATPIADTEHDFVVVSVAVPKVSKEDLEAEAAEAAISAESAAGSETAAPEAAEGDAAAKADDAAAKKE